MTPEAAAEIAMCNECISHLLENVGPDHIIVKYRAALIKLQEQAEEIKRLQDALIEERKNRLPTAPDAYWSCRRDEAERQLRAEGVIK